MRIGATEEYVTPFCCPTVIAALEHGLLDQDSFVVDKEDNMRLHSAYAMVPRDILSMFIYHYKMCMKYLYIKQYQLHLHMPLLKLKWTARVLGVCQFVLSNSI